ncbi:MAG TPA: hypothetical protein VHV32_19010 [Candidatus Angelobacter sp.]|jgi:hypothetical protein|nr:hypothetical protein [Candidatus Angelobacter sp.]
MGEVAEMMLDGTLCQVCGELLGDACGFPRTCKACKWEDKIERQVRPKISCPTCGKKVKEAGLADHQRDVHANAPSGGGLP